MGKINLFRAKIEDIILNFLAPINSTKTLTLSKTNGAEVLKSPLSANFNLSENIQAAVVKHNKDEASHESILVELAKKANTNDVNTNLATKADNNAIYSKSETDSALNLKVDKTDVTLTKQGNEFNASNQLVKLNTNGQLPPIDGSLLTGVSINSTFSNLGSISSNFALESNKIIVGHFSNNYTFTLPVVTDSTQRTTCVLDFSTSNTTYPNLSGLSNLKWHNNNGGKAPSSFSNTTGVRNVLVFKSIWIDSVLYWETEYIIYGAAECTFLMPNLSSNGTLGGSSFAVSASGEYDVNYAWKGADSILSTQWNIISASAYYIWYNPSVLKVSQINMTNMNNGGYVNPIGAYTLYGSNDNSTYTALVSGTNTVSTVNGTWNIIVPEANRGFYKYYKLSVAAANGNAVGFAQGDLIASYIAQ